MARDGSGTHSLPQAAFVSGTTIESAKVNSNFSDISAALTASIAKDGQTVPTANLPMGGFKHTGVADGSARTDYAALGQVAKGSFLYAIDTGSATAYAIAPSPGISAYVVGYSARFKAVNANSGTTPTLAVNGLAAGTITWPNGAALAAGDIPANAFVECICTSTTPTWHLQTVSVPAINQSATGPTTQNLTSGTSATYTTPAGVKWIKIRAVGGGGGGGGTGSSTSPTGATGGTTTFNSVNAIGGSGGTGVGAALGTVGGAGGTGGTGTATRRSPGSAGSANSPNASTATGGPGGASLFGGLGTNTGGGSASVGGSAAANSGSGGNGATGTAGATNGGAGGGAGEYYELIIVNPSATYTYTVGGGGAGGIGTGSNTATGGAGGSGFITVEEHYNL